MKRSNEDIVLESLLRNLPQCPSVSFTDDVMRRVAQTPRPAGMSAAALDTPADDSLPWWTRALLEPVTILAFLVAALLAGWPAQLLRWSSEAAMPFAVQWTARMSAFLDFSTATGSWTAILLLFIFGSLVLSYFAYRGSFFAGSLRHSIERAPRRQ
jgi:hypothetical protein